jgi:hypothetical protein
MVNPTPSSFFTDGGVYDEADVVSNDTAPSTSSSVPSSFYPDGNIYDQLAQEDEVVALLQQLAATTTTNAADAASSATAAHTSEVNAATAVQIAAGTATPIVDGTAAVGTSTKWAHEDHVHPKDPTLATTSYVDTKVASVVNSAPTTLDTLNELAAALGNDPNFATTTATQIGLKAPAANPVFTGTTSAPTPTAGDNSTKIATTAFVQTAVPAAATAAPLVDGTAVVGVATKYAREDHVHPAPPFASITSKPTTVAGFGITDALTANSFPAWTSYSPTIGNITGTVTPTGRYFKLGKLVFVTITLAITSPLTGTMSISLPIPSAGYVAMAAKEQTLTGIGGSTYGGGTSVWLLKDDGSQYLTSGMNIIISGTYEAA